MSPTVKAGRPCKLTTDVSEKICAGLRAGMARKGACGLARVSYESLVGWLRLGREARERGAEASESIFLQFLLAVEEAEAGVEHKCVEALLGKIEEGDVAAARYWLACRRRWQEPTQRIKQTIKLDVERLSDGELEKRIARLESTSARGISVTTRGESEESSEGPRK